MGGVTLRGMKIATWNVNGIRAREAQLCDWLARDRPDVVCLQEIKARPDQVPDRCKLADYHAFWHGAGGYSGVSLHVRRELLQAPEFAHPEFDMETRIVQVALDNLVLASVYVPNGGKDYDAKLRFLQSLVDWARALHEQGRELILCGDINIARADIDVHPRERKPGVIGQRDEERALFEALLGDYLVDVTRALDPDNDRAVHLVAALARHAQAQHRLADRLHPRLARDRRARDGVPGPGRRRHQRSRAAS